MKAVLALLSAAMVPGVSFAGADGVTLEALLSASDAFAASACPDEFRAARAAEPADQSYHMLMTEAGADLSMDLVLPNPPPQDWLILTAMEMADRALVRAKPVGADAARMTDDEALRDYGWLLAAARLRQCLAPTGALREKLNDVAMEVSGGLYIISDRNDCEAEKIIAILSELASYQMVEGWPADVALDLAMVTSECLDGGAPK